MLQIYVTLWGRWFVCLCVSLLRTSVSHFLPFKIHLTNISPILIKMADFKTLAWATSFANWASRKIHLLALQGKWGKKLLSYPSSVSLKLSTWTQYLNEILTVYKPTCQLHSFSDIFYCLLCMYTHLPGYRSFSYAALTVSRQSCLQS